MYPFRTEFILNTAKSLCLCSCSTRHDLAVVCIVVLVRCALCVVRCIVLYYVVFCCVLLSSRTRVPVFSILQFYILDLSYIPIHRKPKKPTYIGGGFSQWVVRCIERCACALYVVLSVVLVGCTLY